jgi:LacI family transcriptional regulator
MPAPKQSTPEVPSFKSIAAMAGVSVMTVSRVLNGSPKVATETRRRVEALIRQTGYQPDPHLLRLMARVRQAKQQETKATIAVVRDALGNEHYRYVPLAAIAARAEQHGYQVEEFFLGRNRLTAKRLRSILQTRGIEALIASPPSLPRHLPDFDFSDFASVTFGYGLRQPELHRVSSNMTQGILSALKYLSERGYRRIGMVITEWIDQRADYTYSGALLHYQQSIPQKSRLPLLYLPNEAVASGKETFLRWLDAHQADALITLDHPVPSWIQAHIGIKAARNIGLMVHDWTPEMKGLAGIDHRREEVAKAAVDLLVSQLMHNEKGIPEVPRQILIPPRLRINPVAM